MAALEEKAEQERQRVTDEKHLSAQIRYVEGKVEHKLKSKAVVIARRNAASVAMENAKDELDKESDEELDP